MRGRLLREARAAARVNHPNVCQIFEAGEIDGEPFLAMELLEGEPLAARLERGAVPPAEAMRVVQSVLDALDALHQRGVVHRDLKPGNVFLSAHGVKVLDFGPARPAARDDRTELQLTRPGSIVGTPRYMAPEQWAGEVAGRAADLFAVGAILFEMLAGRPAFHGASLAELGRVQRILGKYGFADRDEAIALVRTLLDAGARGAERLQMAATCAALEGRADDARRFLIEFETCGFRDPEGLYMTSLGACLAGLHDRCAAIVARCVDSGFYSVPTFRNEPLLRPLRDRPEFDRAMALAEERHQAAVAYFAKADGPRILGT